MTKKKRSEKSEKTRMFKFRFLEVERIQDPQKLLMFIRWIAVPRDEKSIKTHQELAKKIGVSKDTLTDWKKLPNFWKEVELYEETFFHSKRSEYMYGLVKSAIKGNPQSAKLLLQKYEGFRESARIEGVSAELSEEELERIGKATGNWLKLFDKMKDKNSQPLK